MRVYAPLDDPTVEELDQAATKKGISRAQILINAVDSYLHQPEPSTEELDQLRITLDQKNSELDQLRIKLDQANLEMDQIRIRLDQSNTEAANIKDELDRLKTKYNQAISDATQRWEETKGNRKEIDRLRRELEDAGSQNQKLKDELLRRQSELDQLSKIREDLAASRAEADKLKETLSIRSQDISFLQGHVSQLTQSISQLSLKPGEEEIKKKGWWQFWK
jgi:chromosome segregation ATPase